MHTYYYSCCKTKFNSLLDPKIDGSLPGGSLSPDAGLDLSADVGSPNGKHKSKGFKVPPVEGSIDIQAPRGRIGLDVDLSPNSSQPGTKKGPHMIYCPFYRFNKIFIVHYRC